MQCTDYLWGICLVPVNGAMSLFGFKDFIAALALLIIIYTMSDIRYRFRVSVAPTPLLGLTYVLIGLIGFGTLATDVWINEQWLVPNSLITSTIWQGTLAVLFLGLVMTWMYYAFIKPPIFSRNNYLKYARELYRIILKGSDAELPVIAHELSASARSMVALAAALDGVKADVVSDDKLRAERYASDMLLLIANRRFCRHLVASSPATAICFLEAIAEFNAYHVPIGLFVKNVSAEAIQNKESSLYYEDDAYYSGLMGYIKPLSQALYGNHELVEALRYHSPLDIHYKLVWAWDADQFATYCRVVQMTLNNYLETANWGRQSYALTHALHEVRDMTSRALSDIDKAGDDYYGDAWDRLRVGVDFMRDSVNAIGKLNPPLQALTLLIPHRERNRVADKDLYDQLAEAMFEIIHSAGYIDSPSDKAWGIHYNAVWSRFFESSRNDGRAWKIVQLKLRRLLYDEIRDLESFPNYKAARILGVCLSVMGLTIGKRSGFGREYAALKAVVLVWTRRNYLRLRALHAEVADSCLIGSITFDPNHLRLVKTYAKGLRPEPDREYLPLDSPAVAA